MALPAGNEPSGGAEVITLRPATAADAPAAARLILSSMGRFGEMLLGFGDGERARAVMERWYARPGHRFSYRFATLARLQGETAGLLLGFAARDLWRLELGLGPLLRLTYTPRERLRFLRRNVALVRLKEAEPGDWLVAHLATAPACRRRGVGRRLLAEAERLAASAGCTRCALLVELDNAPARALYARLGYEPVAEQRGPLLEALGSAGLARLVKPLAAPEDRT